MALLPEPKTLDFLVAQVSRLHHQRIHELLDTLGLYRGQPPVILALQEQDGLIHGELAGRLGVTPATMTRMIQRMEKAGFVIRKPDESDQRVSRVYLTRTGRSVSTKLDVVQQQMDIDCFDGLSEQERKVLRKLLMHVRENLMHAIQEDLPV